MRRILCSAVLLLGLAFAWTGCGDANGVSVPTATQTASADDGIPVVDLSRLPLGDGRSSRVPEIGSVYLCEDVPPPPTLAVELPWINEDGTWNAALKTVVEGEIMWPAAQMDIVVAGTIRLITGNGLPNHATGEFPILPGDEAYQYASISHGIVGHTVAIEVPAIPVVADEPTCIRRGEPIGILRSGSLLFHPLDDLGRDAGAYEMLDSCQGHPHTDGLYHYHSVTTCLDDTWEGAHSKLVGYALDGFGIYGHYGTEGEVLTSNDLDECHGHTHEVEWDGEMREMYHYHATWEYPYVIGCFRGEPGSIETGPAAQGQAGS